MLLEILAARAPSGSRLACCLAGPRGHFQQRAFPASQPVSNMKHDTWFFPPRHGLCIFPDSFHVAFPGSLLQPVQALCMGSLPLSVSTQTSSSTRFQHLLEARALWFLPVTSANQLLLAPAAGTFLNVNSSQPRHGLEHQLVRYLK